MSSAAKKAWATRRRGKSKSKTKRVKKFPAKVLAKEWTPRGVKQLREASKHKGKGKKKGKMPANVVQYFKNLNAGMSKAEARKEAGLPPAGKKKKWGPGHPLYDWQQKQK